MKQSLLDVERGPQALHIWLGAVGAHFFWPDVWKSRPDYCRRWRERAS